MDSATPMTADYDVNSTHQQAANLRNVEELYETLKTFREEKTITLADVGCATGLNSMKVFRRALLRLKEDTDSQVLVHHVDVPTNEWGVLFRNYWSEEESYRTVGNAFVSAVGGTMYGRLFPDNYLNIVYSAFTLHWLSKKTMPQLNAREEDVRQAALEQSMTDLEQFLTCRLQELKPMGRLIIRTSSSFSFAAPLTYSIDQLKADGLLPTAVTLTPYNAVYHRSVDEYLAVIQRFEGKLKVLTAKTERTLHPLWAPGTVIEDPDRLAERRMLGLKAAATSSMMVFFKALNLDPFVLLPIVYTHIKGYYLAHPEPVYLDEAFLVLEKLPTPSP